MHLALDQSDSDPKQLQKSSEKLTETTRCRTADDTAHCLRRRPKNPNGVSTLKSVPINPSEGSMPLLGS